ncbi:hypothetical protein HOLleu_23963 [Holothuria leucospilota]|uniref:Uncharacterized protein n=1 Tax=Holothuria leucospilota TaxID=206669 RepID=A0A9Q1BW58_HOLLE|nr:hypothetical protein HOLleu_23963 [Holothuria leucospilota]
MNKTKLLVFGTKVPNTENIILTLNKTRVPASRHTKFIGTIIDCKLSWKEHISSVCSKISRRNGVLNNPKYFLPQSTLLLLYSSLIFPHVNYNLLLWGNAKKRLLTVHSFAAKRAVLDICNVSFTHHTGPLFKSLSILSVFDLYKYHLGVFMHNFIHNKLPKCYSNFYVQNRHYHDCDTRKKHLLTIPYSRTCLTKSRIRHSGAVLWTSLHDHVKHCISL